jgi:hypothetical protein
MHQTVSQSCTSWSVQVKVDIAFGALNLLLALALLVQKEMRYVQKRKLDRSAEVAASNRFMRPERGERTASGESREMH